MALDERAHIARELNDVLAHSLGALGVQLEVAEALLTERGDVDGAVGRIRRSRALAREGLVEGQVGRGGAPRGRPAAARRPRPARRRLPRRPRRPRRSAHDRHAQAHQPGRPRSACSGRPARPSPTPPGTHPRRPVTVELGCGEGAVRLVVRNPCQVAGAPSRYGHGLQGMSERLALAGGTLRAGPDDGGWEVRAEVLE